MAIAFVQSATALISNAVLSKAFTSNNTAGNALFCCVRFYNTGSATYTCTDSRGNTWVKVSSGFLSHGTSSVDLWYTLNCAGGANTVTLTCSNPNNPNPAMVISEYSGLALSAALDQTNSAQSGANSNAPNSGNITTTQASELLIGFCENETAAGLSNTPGTGWTAVATPDGDVFVCQQIVSVTGTYSFNSVLSASVAWGAIVASFKAVASAPSPASIAPPSGVQGTTINVTVSGTNFDAGGTSTLSFSGTGITVNSYGTRNATTLVANITISGGAPLGARNVIITNADTQTGILVAAFTVKAPAPPPAPQSITPPSGQQNTSLSVTVSGTNFDAGGTATLSFSGTGIIVSGYGTRNGTTLIANISIASNALLGARNVIITNADTQNATLPLAFTIVAPFTPDITVPLPFGDRLTACAAVFQCVFIASPQGAQRIPASVSTLAAISLSYAQLLSVYARLINTDTANLPADLNAAIDTAVTVVGTLNTTIQAMTATGDLGIVLAGMKIVIYNALIALQKVQEDEAGTPF